jgi:hypothetical protein
MSRWQIQHDREVPETAATLNQLGDALSELRPGGAQPAGLYRRLLNGEIRRGYPETRRGTRPARWCMQEAAGVALPLGAQIQGAAWFTPVRPRTSRPMIPELLVVAVGDVWECRRHNAPRRVRRALTSAGQACELIPAATVCLILRGLEQAPVLYDPTGERLGRRGVVDLPAAAGGKLALPAASTGTYAGNRIWLRSGVEEVIASDLLEYHYTSTSVFTAESSGNGAVVRLWPYADDSLLVFKRDLVVQFTGISDLSTMVARRVYGARGLLAPYSVAQDGDVLYYLSARGPEVLRLGTDGQLVQAGADFSAPVARRVDAIDWSLAEQAVGVVYDGYYLLSVPSRATRGQVDAIGLEIEGAVSVPQDVGSSNVWTPGAARFFQIPFTVPFAWKE